jgi:hypothetical protein
MRNTDSPNPESNQSLARESLGGVKRTEPVSVTPVGMDRSRMTSFSRPSEDADPTQLREAVPPAAGHTETRCNLKQEAQPLTVVFATVAIPPNAPRRLSDVTVIVLALVLINRKVILTEGTRSNGGGSVETDGKRFPCR